MGYPPAIAGDYLWCVSSVGLECRPVTPEVTGSSPVHTAYLREQTANQTAMSSILFLSAKSVINRHWKGRFPVDLFKESYSKLKKG